MDVAAAAPSAKRETHSVGFTLGVIALVVAMGGLGFAYLIDAAGKAKHAVTQPGPGTVARTIGGTSLTIPAAWLASDDESGGSFAKQVDLELTLPLGPKAAPRQIEVSLMPRSRIRPSASLLDGVYLHQFKAEQLNGPPGLIGKPMTATDGYDGETVWYDPLNAQPFTAKCEAPIVEGQAGRCLRAVYLGSGIAAVYSFSDDVLGNWKKFDAEMHPLLTQIGAL